MEVAQLLVAGALRRRGWGGGERGGTHTCTMKETRIDKEGDKDRSGEREEKERERKCKKEKRGKVERRART